MQQGDEHQRCRRKLVLPQGFKKWIQVSGHVSLSQLLYLCLLRSLFRHKSIQSRTLLNLRRVFFTCVFITKRVQLVKQCFSDLIYVPRKDNFQSFTACIQISFQTGCYIEESVTIRATIGLEDCANVAHVTYMKIVSQQSDSILVFLHTLPSEFTYIVPLYNVDIIEKNIE